MLVPDDRWQAPGIRKVIMRRGNRAAAWPNRGEGLAAIERSDDSQMDGFRTREGLKCAFELDADLILRPPHRAALPVDPAAARQQQLEFIGQIFRALHVKLRAVL